MFFGEYCWTSHIKNHLANLLNFYELLFAMYNFKEMEEKWQKEWEEKKAFRFKEKKAKNKLYILEMFQYP